MGANPLRVVNDRQSARSETLAAVAAAGSTAGDAAALSYGMNTAEPPRRNEGRYPSDRVPRAKASVYSSVATNGLKVYPHTGGDINDGNDGCGLLPSKARRI